MSKIWHEKCLPKVETLGNKMEGKPINTILSDLINKLKTAKEEIANKAVNRFILLNRRKEEVIKHSLLEVIEKIIQLLETSEIDQYLRETQKLAEKFVSQKDISYEDARLCLQIMQDSMINALENIYLEEEKLRWRRYSEGLTYIQKCISQLVNCLANLYYKFQPILEISEEYLSKKEKPQEEVEKMRTYYFERKLTIVNSIFKILGETSDLQNALQKIIEKIAEVTGFERVRLGILTETKQGLMIETIAYCGFSEEFIKEVKSKPANIGCTGKAVESGEIVIIDDISSKPDLSVPAAIKEGLHSGAFIPIKAKGKVIGILVVTTVSEQKFSKEDIELLETVVVQLGTVIENLRLMKKEREERNRLILLRELDHIIHSTLDLKQIFEYVYAHLPLSMGVDRVSIRLVDNEKKTLVSEKTLGIHRPGVEELPEEYPIGFSLSGKVAQLGRPIIVDDCSKSDLIPKEWSEKLNLKSCVAAPIRYLDQIVGVIRADDTHQTNRFTQEDIEFLELVASSLGTAIHNAQLFTKTAELTYIDALTGLGNRRDLERVLDVEIARANRFHRVFSVVMLDIDRFKEYNDTYGHLAGDDVLKQIAEIIKKLTRKIDSSIRYGGDEFLIVLPETKTMGAKKVVQKIQNAIRKEKFQPVKERPLITFTLSAGIAVYPTHGHSKEELLRAADMALYKAKNAGGNKVEVFSRRWLETNRKFSSPST